MSEPWYKTAVIYAIDVARFFDSDGDGWGDLRGVANRLDYLASLGVTCLWLLPFFPSPRLDNGYDITEHYGVDPRLGTLQDFVDLVERAGERGMRVMIELIVNHTSDKHPWFLAGRRDPSSRFHDYYIWETSPPPLPPGHRNAFPTQEPSLWTYDEVAGQYYYHMFYRFQPQLDATNPEVREEIKRILDFWLALGVCGFRFDAVPIMVGHDPAVPREREPRAWLREFRTHAISRNPCAVLLGEVDLHAYQLVEYFGSGDQLNMLLDFFLNSHMFASFAAREKGPLLRAMRQLPATPATGQWVNFLRNLDELNLSWLPLEERDVVYEAFAPDEDMRIYERGIARRLAPMLRDRRRIELAFSLLFSMPGTPLIAYGDEIGLGEDMSLPGREPVRVPMQWSAGRNAGFSSADPSHLVQPVVTKGPFGHRKVNVEDQEDDAGSLLNWFRLLVRTWRGCPEFGLGSWHPIDSTSSRVLAHIVIWRNGTVVALHNFSPEQEELTVDVTEHRGERLLDLFGNATQQDLGKDRFRVALPAYGYQWYRVLGRHDPLSYPPTAYDDRRG